MRINIKPKEEKAIENRLKERNESEFEFVNQEIVCADGLIYQLIVKVKKIDKLTIQKSTTSDKEKKE